MEIVCYAKQELSSYECKTEQTGLVWDLKTQWDKATNLLKFRMAKECPISKKALILIILIAKPKI